MKNKKISFLSQYAKPLLVFTTFLVLSIGTVSAQTLTPFVIAASGGFYSNDSGMLSFTTGEMVAVETYITSNIILTQGFQQPLELGTAVPRVQEDYISCEMYPNPSDGKFNLVMQSQAAIEVEVSIVDLQGRRMLAKTVMVDNTLSVYPFDVTNLQSGSYLVLLTPKEHPMGIPMIKKIQIIR